MASTDLRLHVDAEWQFLALCFHRPPSEVDFQRLLANAATGSFDMQQAVLRMTVDAAAGLRAMRQPMLQICGERDALVRARPAARRAEAPQPAIRTRLYAASDTPRSSRCRRD